MKKKERLVVRRKNRNCIYCDQYNKDLYEKAHSNDILCREHINSLQEPSAEWLLMTSIKNKRGYFAAIKIEQHCVINKKREKSRGVDETGTERYIALAERCKHQDERASRFTYIL